MCKKGDVQRKTLLDNYMSNRILPVDSYMYVLPFNNWK